MLTYNQSLVSRAINSLSVVAHEPGLTVFEIDQSAITGCLTHALNLLIPTNARYLTLEHAYNTPRLTWTFNNEHQKTICITNDPRETHPHTLMLIEALKEVFAAKYPVLFFERTNDDKPVRATVADYESLRSKTNSTSRVIFSFEAPDTRDCVYTGSRAFCETMLMRHMPDATCVAHTDTHMATSNIDVYRPTHCLNQEND